jgi:metallo-beta-lactamase class B
MRILFSVLSFFVLPNLLLAQAKTSKLDIVHLTGDAYVYSTYHEYKGNLISSNSVYLLTSDGAVLFDTPWDSTQFQPLLDSIKFKHGKKVVLCIATHSHEDRTGGLEFYRQKGIKTYTTRQTDLISQVKQEKRAEFLLEKDSTFQVGQYKFQTFYPGPGHTPDNIVIWVNKSKILYGGCFVKSTEASDLGNLADANVAAWPQSIKHVQQRFKHPKYVIPGHQGWSSRLSLIHTLDLIATYQRSKH